MAVARRGGKGALSTQRGALSRQRSAPDAWAPDAERLVSDVETLKALSDPLRLRILEVMVTRLDEPWTAKELAFRLNVPQTRLYHHIEVLLERDLVRIAEQHVISGIIETGYRVTATTFRLDQRLLSGDGALKDASRDLLHTVFDSARDELARALHGHLAGSDTATSSADDGPSDRPIVNRCLARLTPARAAEFRTRINALIREFGSDPAAAGDEPWSLLVAFYRLEDGTQEASHD